MKRLTDANFSLLFQGDEPLFPGSTVTQGQNLLLLVSHILRHHVNSSQLKDLLALLDILFPGTFPATKFLFSKYMDCTDMNLKFHLYCGKCQSLLPDDEGTQGRVCPDCQTRYVVDTIVKNGHFFLTLSLESQVQDLLENHDLTLIEGNQKEYNEQISGVHDGDFMLDLLRSGAVAQEDLSLLWNCDGVPVFKSTQFAIWPIQVVLNELQPKIKKDNVLIVGMQFGPVKPQMDTFLQPFVTECTKL